MTAPPRAPFPTRLELARRLIARGAARPAVHIADQLAAASRDTRALHDRLGVLLPLLEPERTWRRRTDLGPADETRAYLLAAQLGSVNVCVHLRRGGPQPAICRLPLHRIDCRRCVQTLYRPATSEDQCDVCEGRGVAVFHPFAVHLGPLLLTGDACRDCAAVLGIVQEVSA